MLIKSGLSATDPKVDIQDGFSDHELLPFAKLPILAWSDRVRPDCFRMIDEESSHLAVDAYQLVLCLSTSASAMISIHRLITLRRRRIPRWLLLPILDRHRNII